MRRSVHIALGLVLIAAAGLKCIGLGAENDLNWWTLLQCEAEFLMGAALVIGVWPEWTNRLALAAFFVFAQVALYKVLTSAADCGCFGAFRVNPMYTLSLDLVAIGALLCVEQGAAMFPDLPKEELQQ